MKQELQEKLTTQYAELFGDRTSRNPFPMFGIECGDGWYDLLNHLCSVITSQIDNTKRHNRFAVEYNQILENTRQGIWDWNEISKYFGSVTEERREQFKAEMELKSPRKLYPDCEVVITQIKEKFGGLRFYYDGGDEYIAGAVHLAESMSYKICEQCGEKGDLRGVQWLYTACDQHTKPGDPKFGEVKENLP